MTGRYEFGRRQFLLQSSLFGLVPSAQVCLSAMGGHPARQSAGRILVTLQLSGGNDGINTVVPYRDEGYARHRNETRLSPSALHRIDAELGLHPAMSEVAELLEAGSLAIVQGVGYPNPNRSHDVSMRIWHTGRPVNPDRETRGWLGRAIDMREQSEMSDELRIGDERPSLRWEHQQGSPHIVQLGDEALPLATFGRYSTRAALSRLDDLRLRSTLAAQEQTGRVSSADRLRVEAAERFDSDTSARVRTAESTLRRQELKSFLADGQRQAVAASRLLDDVLAARQTAGARYPGTNLARRLEMISQLIKADFGSPIYYTIQPGYDTHAAQAPTHQRLLGELSGAIGAFFRDLTTAGVADRVTLVCFSEFGRRVAENGSFGTDHGTAGPVLVVGPNVRSGLIGETPKLTELVNGDLQYSIDFRQVYASLLTDWLGFDATSLEKPGELPSLSLFAN